MSKSLREQLAPLVGKCIQSKPSYYHKGKAVYLAPMGSINAPLELRKGEIGRAHPSRIPTMRVTNSEWVGQYSKTFGCRSRMFYKTPY